PRTPGERGFVRYGPDESRCGARLSRLAWEPPSGSGWGFRVGFRPGVGPALRLLGGLVRARGATLHAQILAVRFDDLARHVLHEREVVHRLERPVLVAIRDDRLGPCRADAVQLLRESGGIGGVDVDRAGEHRARDECAKKG